MRPLLAWARSFAAQRMRVLPWISFGADMLENGIVLALLLAWPDHIIPLAAALAWFTVSKRAAMLAALLLPPLVRGAVALRARGVPASAQARR